MNKNLLGWMVLLGVCVGINGEYALYGKDEKVYSKSDHINNEDDIGLDADILAALYATLNGNADALKELKSARANIITFLNDAIVEDDLTTINELIAGGANVNGVDWLGDTPLMAASKVNSNHIIKLLLDAKADVNIQNRNGFTALDYAILNSNADVIRELEAAGAEVVSTLIEAAEYGDLGTFQALISAGAYLNAVAEYGAIALMNAIQAGNDRFVKALIKAGFNVNVTTRDGATALMAAVQAGNNDIVKAFIAANADVNHASHSGVTALEMAAFYENNDALKALEAAGAKKPASKWCQSHGAKLPSALKALIC